MEVHMQVLSTRIRVAMVVAVAAALAGSMSVGASRAAAQSAGGAPGAVYSMTNNAAANTITAFQRGADGTLAAPRSFPTGGQGTGTPEDSANGLILANVSGESAPINTKAPARLLLATNGGSNSISVFRVTRDGLELADVEDSRGNRPISVTVNRGIAYVLNAGGPMCSGVMNEPEIEGFTISARGELTPLPGSSRPLSGGNLSGCTQVSFDKTGKVLVVDEQQADIISTYVRNDDGTVTGPTPQQSTGNGPFGFTFTQRNQLITTENFGAAPGQGAAASYEVDERTGALSPISPSVRNMQSDTCWVVITDDNRLAFTSSFGDDGGISSYRVAPDGNLTLLRAQAATPGSGSSDLTLSNDSRYLYAKNTVRGTVTAYRVEDSGDLVEIQEVQDGGLAGSIGLAGK
jgi:6-phosphogluconolactonase (cycloisomerase 2 family)